MAEMWHGEDIWPLENYTSRLKLTDITFLYNNEKGTRKDKMQNKAVMNNFEIQYYKRCNTEVLINCLSTNKQTPVNKNTIICIWLQLIYFFSNIVLYYECIILLFVMISKSSSYKFI